MFAWLIGSGHGAETDRQAVPAIDRDDGHGQIGQLLRAELAARGFIGLVGDMIMAQQSDGFGPGEGRAFARGKERRLFPDRDRVETLLGFALARASLVCMSTQ